jgi:hypothetical protein
MASVVMVFSMASSFTAAVVAMESAIISAEIVVASAEVTIASAEATVDSTESTIMVAEVAAPVIAELAVLTKFALVEAIKPAHVVIAPIEFRMHVVKVIPRSGSDKNSVDEPFRTPIAIGRATIGIIRVEPIRAHRRRIVDPVTGAYPDANRNLRLRMECR